MTQSSSVPGRPVRIWPNGSRGQRGRDAGLHEDSGHAASRQILGAAILGPGGDEAIHCILDVMYAKVPYTVSQRVMHIHPTVSELIPTMLGELKPL
jgi:pyruvate/2-oxoglutarate dehydrogenase complex dihydrolipoamide dehydrogenase (E3) component